MADAATLILTGADVRCMDAANSRAEAVAVAGGRILAVGTAGQMETLRTPQTLVLDARGATVLPGLIDGHGHFGHVARSMATAVDCRTPPAGSVADMLAAAARRVSETPAGSWILLQGTTFQDRLVAERRFPTPQELSALSDEHPIVYRSSIHHLVLNRCALRTAGIDADSEDPAGAARIERDPSSGEPTGVLAEMFDRLPIEPPTEQQLASSIERVAREHYLANGVTSIQEIWDSADVMRLMAAAVRAQAVPLRVKGFGWVPLAGSVKEVASAAIGGVPLQQDWFEAGGVKLFVDGGSSSHTAAFYEEYLDAPGSRGALSLELGELVEHIRCAQSAGAQVALHAVGDLAQDIALAALELAGAERHKHLRHRIEHGGNVAWNARRSAWCKRLGVLPVPNLGFIYNYGEFWRQSLGERRAKDCVPLRSMIEEGFPVPSSSDTTGGDPRLLNPFHNIWCAVTRKTMAGRVVDPGQRVGREQALAMYTRHAARAGHWEGSRGSIEPGKLADLVVLEQALDDVSDEDLQHVSVAHTIVDGQLRYSRGGAA